MFFFSVAILAFFSCKTSGTLEGGFDAGPVGVKGGVTWTAPQPTMTVSGQLPPGDCLQLDFYDNEGNLCGSTGPVKPPYVGSLPEGVGPKTPCVAQIVPCPEETPEELLQAGPNATKLVKRRFFYWCSYPNLTTWDPLTNTTIIADIWVGKAKNNDNIGKVLQRMAVKGVSSPPPPFVEVIHFAQVKPTASGDADLVVAQRDYHASPTLVTTGATAGAVIPGANASWHWNAWHLDIDANADKVGAEYQWSTPEGPQHFGSWFEWL